MAVKSIIYNGESYDSDVDSKRSYTRTYHVICQKGDTPYTIINSTGANLKLPAPGDKHPNDTGLYVSKVHIDEATPEDRVKYDTDHSSHLVYTAQVTYENINSSWAADSGRYTRARGAYNVSLDVVTYTDTLRRGYTATTNSSEFNSLQDKFDKRTVPVVTAAKEFVRVETTLRNLLLRFDYDTRTFKSSWMVGYLGSCNSKAITIAGYNFAATQGKLLKLQPVTAFDSSGKEYYTVSVEIEAACEKPVRYQSVLNAGYKYLVAGKPVPIGTDGNGNYGQYGQGAYTEAITEPYPLDADGNLLTGWPTTPETYIKVYDTFLADWDSLGFPDDAKERKNVR